MAKLKSVPILRSPKGSFDNTRPPSELVMQQVAHAHEELKKWLKENDSPPPEIDTEQEAADYIRAVTRVLHPEGTPADPSDMSVIDLGNASELSPKRKRRPAKRRRQRTARSKR